MPQKAQGIPDEKEYGDIGSLSPRQLFDYVVQRHQAARAGLHTDLRLGNKDTGLLSWALRKGMPQPGEKHLAVQQPLHSHEYGSFSGKIEQGYGKGQVDIQDKGQVLITRSSPQALHFTVAHKGSPERFVLLKTNYGKDQKGWLLTNVTPSKPLEHGKRRFTPVPSEEAEAIIKNMPEGSSVSPKIDGASMIMPILKDRIEAVSFRTSSKTNRPIYRTESIFGGIPSPKDLPTNLRGSILRGEAHGIDSSGKVIPPQSLGGLLNSSISKSLKDQKDRGIDLRTSLFDIERYGKKPIDYQTPRADRQKMLQEVFKYLPKDKIELTEQATEPTQALNMWNQIKSDKYPLTSEGVIYTPPTGQPSKIKLRPEYDTYIRDIFAGEGKYKGVGAGGFTYSHQPDSPVVGRVGTGLSDELRKRMWSNPEEFKGRIAIVLSQQKLPSGALRAPSLIGQPVFHSLHEDIP